MNSIQIRVKEVIALAPEVEQEVRVDPVEEEEDKINMMIDRKAPEVKEIKDAVEKKGEEGVVEIMIVMIGEQVKIEEEVETQWKEEVGEGVEMIEMIEEAVVAMVEIEIEGAEEETRVMRNQIQHYSLVVLTVTSHKIKLEKCLVNSVKLEMSKSLRDSALLNITIQSLLVKLKTNCMKQTYLELEELLE